MTAQVIFGIVSIFAAICSALAAIIGAQHSQQLSSLDGRVGRIETHLMGGK